jgi:hypothetical protein
MLRPTKARVTQQGEDCRCCSACITLVHYDFRELTLPAACILQHAGCLTFVQTVSSAAGSTRTACRSLFASKQQQHQMVAQQFGRLEDACADQRSMQQHAIIICKHCTGNTCTRCNVRPVFNRLLLLLLLLLCLLLLSCARCKLFRPLPQRLDGYMNAPRILQ